MKQISLESELNLTEAATKATGVKGASLHNMCCAQRVPCICRASEWNTRAHLKLVHRCIVIPSACLSVSLPLFPLLFLPPPVTGFVHYFNDFACIVSSHKWRCKSVVAVTPGDKSLASARKPKGQVLQNVNSCYQTAIRRQLVTVADFDLSESVVMSLIHWSHCRFVAVGGTALPHRCYGALTCRTCPTSVPGICVPVIAFEFATKSNYATQISFEACNVVYSIAAHFNLSLTHLLFLFCFLPSPAPAVIHSINSASPFSIGTQPSSNWIMRNQALFMNNWEVKYHLKYLWIAKCKNTSTLLFICTLELSSSRWHI